ncbi:MAG: hypothetical protein CFE21_17185 [Bacteroidetes bacterium B1(2017)]|nr:MAG: hypothetical protein CFE21_17185 [Bacteroidetes bacterium B1(2017)]
MKSKLPILLLILFSSLAALAQTAPKGRWTSIPKPIGWVNDYENIFTAAEIKSLDSLIGSYEKKTSIEIAVVTVPLEACTREEFDSLMLKLAQTWGVGKKGKNNGIVIGISKEHRKIRIENGLGIEMKLSDAQTKEIIDKILIPNFRAGHYYLGIAEGIQEIKRKLDTN